MGKKKKKKEIIVKPRTPYNHELDYTLETVKELAHIMKFVNFDDEKRKHKKKCNKIVEGIERMDEIYVDFSRLEEE